MENLHQGIPNLNKQRNKKGILTTINLASQYRSEFPIFERLTYVNSCSHGALAKTVKESFTTYISTLEEKGSSWNEWVTQQEILRKLMAQFLSAAPEEIAITTSASAGINALATSLNFSGKRNKIVTTNNEFPTMGQIWHAQESRGAKVVHIPNKSDLTVDTQALIDAIDDETLLVAIAHVCYRNGVRTDIHPIIEAAHKKGALVVLDAYQSVGSLSLNVNEIKADIIVGGLQKYMLAVPGVGFMYARQSTTSALVPYITGWFAAQDIFAMKIDSYQPAQHARRFENGTPNVAPLYPATAALELILEIGILNIEKYVSTIHEALREGIAEIGGTIVTPRNAESHGALLAVASTDENAHVSALEEIGIITSSRDGNVRLSPHFYNNFEDVEKIINGFIKTKAFLSK
jgi:selenocysteine lyase/cysteine desulfurase